MTLQAKLRADFWLGGLLLALLYGPVRMLGHLLRRDHSTSHRRGCVVIKLVGAGSLFLAMPSMQEIRRTFPPGRFYLVGTPAVIKVAKEFGWFDEYWTIEDGSVGRLLWSAGVTLWRMARRADHLIDLEVHSRFTTVFGVLSMVRNRIGFVDEIVFWRRAFYTHMTFYNVHGPVYVFYDMLASWFGIDTVPVTAFNDVFRSHVMATALPAGTIPAVPFVAVGHACSALGRERQLHPDEWKLLLAPVILSGLEIVLLGGPDDVASAEAIIAVLGCGRNLCGRLTVSQSAKVLAGASANYGIDSILLHFARAMGVPSVSVFGPTDPATRLRPMTATERVAFARLPCSPCVHVNETPPCQGKRPCMALALENLLAFPDQRPGIEPTPPSVGWQVDPATARVRVSSMICS
jgi:ADP-heptose:LPS heptosyltransferase